MHADAPTLPADVAGSIAAQKYVTRIYSCPPCDVSWTDVDATCWCCGQEGRVLF